MRERRGARGPHPAWRRAAESRAKRTLRGNRRGKPKARA
jgi:hypothetical protein